MVVFPLLTKSNSTVSSSWEKEDGAGGVPLRWGQLEQDRGWDAPSLHRWLWGWGEVSSAKLPVLGKKKQWEGKENWDCGLL